MRIWIYAALAASSLMAGQAIAGPQSHCEVVGKDTADSRSTGAGSDQWQTAYSSAYSDCMMQYGAESSDTVAAAETSSDPGTPAVNSSEPENTVTKSKPRVVQQKVKTTKNVKSASAVPPKNNKNKPARGTTAWNNYCAAKYASFNPRSGTYKSYSGKRKPCLVGTKSASVVPSVKPVEPIVAEVEKPKASLWRMISGDSSSEADSTKKPARIEPAANLSPPNETCASKFLFFSSKLPKCAD